METKLKRSDLKTLNREWFLKNKEAIYKKLNSDNRQSLMIEYKITKEEWYKRPWYVKFFHKIIGWSLQDELMELSHEYQEQWIDLVQEYSSMIIRAEQTKDTTIKVPRVIQNRILKW